MNVLVITDKLTTGGAENYYCQLENNLQHPELTFYYAAGAGYLTERIVHKHEFTLLKEGSHFYNILLLTKTVRRKKIDLIHANSLRMVFYGLFLRLLTLKFGSLKLIYTKHNETFLERKWPKIYCVLLNRFVNKIIAVSEFEKENLQALGVNSKNVEVVYNGIDLNHFAFKGSSKVREPFKVGILARLSKEKNHGFFLELVKQLQNETNLQFVIGGDGPERENIEKAIKNSSIAHKVKLVGNVVNPEGFLKEMDAVLLTSHREVMPMVILEAMAVGTNVISIDRGGIKEAVQDGKTGYVIADHDVEHFAKLVLAIRDQQSASRHMALQARQRAIEVFSSEKMVERTLEQYVSMTEHSVNVINEYEGLGKHYETKK